MLSKEDRPSLRLNGHRQSRAGGGLRAISEGLSLPIVVWETFLSRAKNPTGRKFHFIPTDFQGAKENISLISVIYLLSVISTTRLFSITYNNCPKLVQFVVSTRNFSDLAKNIHTFQQLFHSFCENLPPF
jgi:hypothetical protein